MKTLDCLFLHPTTHFRIPACDKESLRYVIMPMGTMALADLLDREGYGVKVVHTGLEQMCNPYFDLRDLLRRYEPSLVGIDLHWYSHAYDAIRIADAVKMYSNAFVVFGGFTASFFAEEILSSFDSVDAIVFGDAEVPLLELLKYLPKKEFKKVPNLLYREGNALKQSMCRYVADERDLNQLGFSNLHLLENWDKYIKLVSENDDLGPKLKTQGWTCIGRGCSVNCSYCGGGKDAQLTLNGRRASVFRSVDRVVETLSAFEELGIYCAYIDFDPYPENRRYYHDLFHAVRREKIDISAEFLLWAPSDRGFLQSFKRTFNPLYSTITLSPESGSEYVRKLNKGFNYTNSELFHWLDHAKNEMMHVELYFSSGLSWETEEHFEETIGLCKKILEEYPMVVGMYCNPIILEPCSPRFIHPRKYGITLKFRKFSDFYETYKRFAEGLPVGSRLGYETDYLSETQIIELSQRFNSLMSPTEGISADKFRH